MIFADPNCLNIPRERTIVSFWVKKIIQAHLFILAVIEKTAWIGHAVFS